MTARTKPRLVICDHATDKRCPDKTCKHGQPHPEVATGLGPGCHMGTCVPVAKEGKERG